MVSVPVGRSIGPHEEGGSRVNMPMQVVADLMVLLKMSVQKTAALLHEDTLHGGWMSCYGAFLFFCAATRREPEQRRLIEGQVRCWFLEALPKELEYIAKGILRDHVEGDYSLRGRPATSQQRSRDANLN